MVIMNPNISLELFLPPAGKDVNFMAANDLNGLNTGLFFIRICPWSVRLLGANLGYEYLPGNKSWDYAEQGQLSNLLRDVPWFHEKARLVSLSPSYRMVTVEIS
jgi:hypothetical protein